MELGLGRKCYFDIIQVIDMTGREERVLTGYQVSGSNYTKLIIIPLISISS